MASPLSLDVGYLFLVGSSVCLFFLFSLLSISVLESKVFAEDYQNDPFNSYSRLTREVVFTMSEALTTSHMSAA